MTTLNELTIEEIKAALKEKEDALAEERRQIAEQEREIKRAAEEEIRKAEAAKRKLTYEVYAKAIVTALVDVGFKNASYDMKANDEFPVIKAFPNAESWSPWSIHFDKVYGSSSRFYSHSSFSIKIIVGDYGNKHSFPVLKAGGYNYTKIAKTVWDACETGKAEAKRKAAIVNNEKSNEARIARLNDKFGKSPYKEATYKTVNNVKIIHYTFYNNHRGGEYTYRKDNDLMLHVDHITEENAEKLIKFMKDNGMLAEEK